MRGPRAPVLENELLRRNLGVDTAAKQTREAENARQVWEALLHFGAPLDDLGITVADLERPDMVVQIGVPPRRIDVLTGVTGLDFKAAWRGRSMVPVGTLSIPFLGRAALIRNKRATGRLKDLADLEALGES